MAFAVYPSLLKKKLGKVVTKLNTTYLNLRLASLSILLIVLCNPSILNPRPTKLNGIKCYFQNVQGLVTFSSLGKPFPNLNQTKICELQAHIFETSPDIVILNETWLKPTIKSNEILPTKIYKIFRIDRSIKSHPPDPNNPQKFRTNGGGVLIGVKESLNLKPKLVDQTCCAEVLSIQLSLPNKKKICLSTVYRVGTLGINNFYQLQKYFSSISASNKFKYSYIIGDFNCDSMNWHLNSSSNSTHSHFLNLFNDLGLTQLVQTATHKHNNILDIFLTDSPDMVEDINVHDPGSFIHSDHSPITSGIKAFLKIPKSKERIVYDYKKANWDSLNRSLSRIDWEHILSQADIHYSWDIFKNKIISLCDIHIPKIKVKESYQPPWFDSEVFRLTKKKKKFRKLFKETKSQNHYSRYSSLRKSLKLLIKSKMNANFDSDLSPNTITKKF